MTDTMTSRGRPASSQADIDREITSRYECYLKGVADGGAVRHHPDAD